MVIFDLLFQPQSGIHIDIVPVVLIRDYPFEASPSLKGELMLIDMDTLCIGDPVFELATVYNSYRQFPDIDPAAATHLGITPGMGSEILDKTLRLYYPDADESELYMIEKKAQVMGCIRIINFMNRHKDHPAYGISVTRCLEDIKDNISKC